jgi:DNA-binding SARP family transcriptional activator
MNRMTTKTLAEIYLQQGHLREAYEIFKSLAEQDPTDLQIQNRLKELSEKLDLPPPSAAEERISTLKEWLSAIQARRKK